MIDARTMLTILILWAGSINGNALVLQTSLSEFDPHPCPPPKSNIIRHKTLLERTKHQTRLGKNKPVVKWVEL